MLLKDPCIITSRLLAGVKIGPDSIISIDYSRKGHSERPAASRTCYVFWIDTPDFSFTDSDIRSGCQGGNLREGLISLLSFLSAAAESHSCRIQTGRIGENEDLFPAHVVEWAHQHSDEISMLGLEIEETSDCIEE